MRNNNYQYSYQNPDLTRPPNNINQDNKIPYNQFHNNNQFYDNQIQQPQENNNMMQFSKNNTPSKNEKPSSSFCSILFSTKTTLFLLLISTILFAILVYFSEHFKKGLKSTFGGLSCLILAGLIILSIVILSIRFIIFLFRKCLKYD
ncbi:hypothetical protein A0H76_1470 [Hepatospora eriocheir]|uniref:Uncharacterized protein n=1 Tax=Hepatospora eriocheir TaxID=1081669 RepID=A0A1X0QHD0_9MICR|nr:hypothetical protein A0H76_1470 [Hepatospora eriocheir]